MLTIEQTPLGPKLVGPETDPDRLARAAMKRTGDFYIATTGSMMNPHRALEMAHEIIACSDAITNLKKSQR